MSATDSISAHLPELGSHLGKESLANLPTPLQTVDIRHSSGNRTLFLKCDNLTGSIYGGNKIRKLEFALHPAIVRNRQRIATFGAVGSNHALATALYASALGLPCTCFLSHQRKTGGTRNTLLAHLQNGTEIVRYGGAYTKRVAVLRQHLWSKQCWVVPAGGSSWLGTIGFVNAGLELAGQLKQSGQQAPDRIYIATGTMGSAAGLGIGLAIAGIGSRIEAIRVSMTQICNEDLLQHLVAKTVLMMRRLDKAIPADIGDRANIRLRHEFFAGGYAYSDKATDAAVAFAKEHLDLTLETTYTGKAMAALLSDLSTLGTKKILFWNTYNSSPLKIKDVSADAVSSLPEEFQSYCR